MFTSLKQTNNRFKKIRLQRCVLGSVKGIHQVSKHLNFRQPKKSIFSLSFFLLQKGAIIAEARSSNFLSAITLLRRLQATMSYISFERAKVEALNFGSLIWRQIVQFFIGIGFYWQWKTINIVYFHLPRQQEIRYNCNDVHH